MGRLGSDARKFCDPLLSLVESNYIPAMAVCAKRESLIAVGMHDPDLVYSDWLLWIALMARSVPGFINRSLAKYRIHKTNTSVGVNEVSHHERIAAVYHKVSKVLPATLNPECRRKIEAISSCCLASTYIRLGKTSQAVDAFRNGLTLDSESVIRFCYDDGFFNRTADNAAQLVSLIDTFVAAASDASFVCEADGSSARTSAIRRIAESYFFGNSWSQALRHFVRRSSNRLKSSAKKLVR